MNFRTGIWNKTFIAFSTITLSLRPTVKHTSKAELILYILKVISSTAIVFLEDKLKSFKQVYEKTCIYLCQQNTANQNHPLEAPQPTPILGARPPLPNISMDSRYHSEATNFKKYSTNYSIQP